MAQSFLRKLSALDLEEKILNGAVIGGIICMFFPWFGGEWLGGDPVSYGALGFYTSLLGIIILLLLLFVLLITLVPLLGGPVLIRKRHREGVRFFSCFQASILTLAVLSVLTNVTFEFSRMEVRFGIYFTLGCSLVATLYAFLRMQEQKRGQIQELFHHPEDLSIADDKHDELKHASPPPPPPPPAPEPEAHKLFP